MQPGLYEIIPAPPALQTFVRRFMYANVSKPVDLTITPAPTGYNYLGHILDGEISALVDGKEYHSQSAFHFSGQIQYQDISVRYMGRIVHLLAEFTATGFYRLLHVSGSEIHGASLDVETIAPKLHRRMVESMSVQERGDNNIAAFTDFLLGLIPDALDEPEFVGAAARLIEQANGRIQVSDVCQELGVNERRLNRLFQDVVGVPPKYFARVIQLNTVVGMLMSNDEKRLTELALECGYYDQAHFIRTMQQFFQQSPREFLLGDNHMFHNFIGKSRTETR